MNYARMRGGVSVTLAIMASGVIAQEKPVALPEVSVSATRVERDNLDLPVAIDSIDQRTIREANPQVNLSESLNRVPGIAVLNRQNYSQDLQISSRGFGARSTFGVRGLRLIADGIPATMPDGQGQAATFSLSSARSIEVLRGPFASLYGNAAGGVVQIFTADGPQQPTFSASALFGSYDTWKLGMQYGGQHGPVNVLVDASRFQTDGYRDHSWARRDHVNAKFKFDAGGAGVFTLVMNVLDQPETQDPLGLTAAQVAQNPRQAGGNPAGANALNFNTRKSVAQSQIGLTYDVAIAPATKLNARVYLGDRQVTQHLAIPLATQNQFIAPGVRTHSGGVVDLDRGYGGAALRLTHETQLGGDPFTLSGGVDFDRMKERRRGFLNNFGVTGDLRRDEDNVVSNTDFYAQAEWRIAKRLDVLAGLRHSRVKFKSTDYFFLTNGNDSGSVDYSRTTPALGATYHITPTFNVYGNIGRGFETPTFAELAYRPGGATGLNFALRPAKSLHREVGVKTLVGDNGRLNLALFRIDVEDEIVVNSNAGGRSDFKNVQGTLRKGLEFGWQQKFPLGFEAALSYTRLDATFKQSFTTVTGTPATPVTVRAGSKLPGIADNIWFGELVWRYAPLGFHAGIEVRHSGKVWVNDQNAEFADAYTIYNVRAGLQQRGRGWKFSEFVRVDNMSDRRYIGSVIVSEANNRFYEPAPGRNYVVGVNAEFSF